MKIKLLKGFIGVILFIGLLIFNITVIFDKNNNSINFDRILSDAYPPASYHCYQGDLWAQGPPLYFCGSCTIMPLDPGLDGHCTLWY